MKLKETKYGFKYQSSKQLDELKITMHQYVHEKSGGLVVYLECDDTNCVGGFGFRTLPEDSTGVCHIIEHSLLCGSSKYPLKEPFVNLLKSSLNTFLNAFTAYDWTMYPFASQTPKDFDNILGVYADAVFNPLSIVDNKPFLQEGWHLELNGVDETPSYKGVVYNEMKGAMSSVDEMLVQSTLEAMYDGTCYAFNSGGDPDVIPSLTYEAYKDFYKRHYTPQNAMTFFYGKMDIEEKLKFLDENYFSKYEKSSKEIVIETPKPLINTTYTKEYEIGTDEDVKDNTYISLCYAIDKYENREEYLAWEILCEVLMGKNTSPVTKALLDAKLGQDVEARIDDDNILPALHVYLKKTNKECKEKFKEVFESTIKGLIKNGIDKESLIAEINRVEFAKKEMDMGRMPKGIVLAMNMMQSFNYRTPLDLHLLSNDCFKLYRKELDKGYFEKLLEKYIINSKHNVEVLLLPSKTLGETKKKLMDEKMASIKESLSIKEKETLVKQTKDLIAYQSKEDTPKELKSLPTLKIKDIPTTVNYLDSKKASIKGIKGIYHEANTNHIGYLRLYFDMKCLSIEEVRFVSLINSFLLNIPTKNYDVLSLSKKIKTFLGDFHFAKTFLPVDENNFEAKEIVFLSALDDNIKYIPELVNEVIRHSKFTDKEIHQILLQIQASNRDAIIRAGNAISAMETRASYSKASALNNFCDNYPGYKFVNGLIKNYNFKELKEKLNGIVKKLFSKKNLFFSISGDSKTLELLKECVANLKLESKVYPQVLDIKRDPIKKDALIIPNGVSYNGMSSSFKELGYEYNGRYAVLSHILNYDYLWPEIRVKGGAYGCGIAFSRREGVLSFTTYRDPNVKNSYEIFNNVANYLKNFKATKDVFTSYIIGSLSGFDDPGSVKSYIGEWDINYILGFKLKDKINLKKQVLKTKQEDIVEAYKLFEKASKSCSIYSVGNEAKIKEYPFDKTNTL